MRIGELGGQLLLGGFRRIQRAGKPITLSANNTTASTDIFQVSGTCLIHAIWAEVTTTIGANHTAGHLRTDDATAQVDITEASTGIVLSGLAVGTVFYKESLAAVALKLLNNAAAKMEEPAAAGTTAHSPFIVTAKTAVATHIEYRYSTTDAPTTGALFFQCLWEPMTLDGVVSPA